MHSRRSASIAMRARPTKRWACSRTKRKKAGAIARSSTRSSRLERQTPRAERSRGLYDATKLTGPLAILKRAARRRARVIIPLLRVARADAADVAPLIDQWLVAGGTHERRRGDRWNGGGETLMRAAQ